MSPTNPRLERTRIRLTYAAFPKAHNASRLFARLSAHGRNAWHTFPKVLETCPKTLSTILQSACNVVPVRHCSKLRNNLTSGQVPFVGASRLIPIGSKLKPSLMGWLAPGCALIMGAAIRIASLTVRRNCPFHRKRPLSRTPGHGLSRIALSEIRNSLCTSLHLSAA
jgi:hypothetical protein